MKKTKIILVLIFIWLIFFSTDYFRAKNNMLPIFCTNLNNIIAPMDGGTKIYFGLGYKVYSFHTWITDITTKKNIKFKAIRICPLWSDYDKVLDKVKNELFPNIKYRPNYYN